MHTGYRCVLLTAHSCTCMTKGSKCMAVSILKLKSRLFQAKYRPTSTGYPVSLPPLRRGQKPQKPRENPPASSGSSVLYIKMVLFGKRPYECIGSDQVNGWSQVIELSRETTSGLENRTAFWRQARVVYSGYLHTSGSCRDGLCICIHADPEPQWRRCTKIHGTSTHWRNLVTVSSFSGYCSR
jgi:hypothetical protein